MEMKQSGARSAPGFFWDIHGQKAMKQGKMEEEAEVKNLLKGSLGNLLVEKPKGLLDEKN